MSDFRKPPRDVDNMTSLRVGNLPYRCASEDLLPLFEKYGDVGDIYFPLERGSGRSRGFAFVRYFDKRDAEDAMDALNGRQYDGRDLRITIDPGRPSRGSDYGGGRGGGGGGRGRSRSRDRYRKRSYSRSRSRSRSRGERRRASRSRSKSADRGGKRREDSRSRSRSRT